MKKNVALVLSSGGARGLAHIGAIEELERRGYCITSIAGCSMGALIGAMYAAGKLAEVKEWMVQLDKKKILSLVDFSFSLNHLVKGEKVMDALKEIVPDVNIEDLPIPYAAVATDWNSGKEVVFKKGSLYEAVRSSISIPLFFNPVRKGEMLLVDGGLVNGLPLNRVARVKGDLLVGVNVSTHDYKEEKLMSDIIDKKTLAKSLPAAIVKRIMDYQEGLGLNYMTLLSRTISIMLEQNTRQQIIISKPDIAVQVQMKRYGGNDYDKAAEISLIGENKMRKALNEYEQAHASIWDQLKSFGK
ncbi:MAG: patatin-like phospholipase family protein [Prevotella shahii]|jgi:phospholipase, patatin family|uniref:NTE family protein n=1 Tax=Hoylesella shahii DSM 15611 = JCM 12083 TaxID=1122991 RepID=A0A318HZ20_9BACT|nr:patatin-like phospholipase family protein [Hoylesella shahii]MBF1568520.1 patatin-like phospholipase family protein [Hoylesella shahii]MBF1591188.1 patatin-like phospholipase family protein [Hoylesella shahii]PXX20088.1 NTE family protein [Hoylesella shahii DSM 15611 = JCM 12083]